tara:strand:- start:177 stop:506 length:330 start_codon:yes stop_codon:yes gene_type:complete
MSEVKVKKAKSLSIFILSVLMGVLYIFGSIDNNRLEKKIQGLEKEMNVFEAEAKMNVNQIYFQNISLSRRLNTLETFQMMKLDPDFMERQKQYKEQLEQQGENNANESR